MCWCLLRFCLLRCCSPPLFSTLVVWFDFARCPQSHPRLIILIHSVSLVSNLLLLDLLYQDRCLRRWILWMYRSFELLCCLLLRLKRSILYLRLGCCPWRLFWHRGHFLLRLRYTFHLHFYWFCSSRCRIPRDLLCQDQLRLQLLVQHLDYRWLWMLLSCLRSMLPMFHCFRYLLLMS